MALEIIIVLIVLAVAVVLFATEKLPIDLVAIMILGTLVLTGILTPEEGVAGFSNSAVITVAAMFILSTALSQTGAVSAAGNYMAKLYKYNFWLAITATMIVVGIVSAFINNTPVVAVFLPILMAASQTSGHHASKMLMPLSFAAMFGGVCTLIGTSTNILVSSITEQNRMQPFGMFEMTPMGMIFFITGIVYMLTVGIRLIPKRKSSIELVEKYELGDYITDIILLPTAPSVGKRLQDSPLVKDLDITVISIERNGTKYFLPSGNMVLRENDILRVRCDVTRINRLKDREGVLIKSGARWYDADLKSDQTTLVEVVIAPHSELEGKTLRTSGFRYKYGATALAIRHRDEVLREHLADVKLQAGDALLLEVKTERLATIKQLKFKSNNPFLIISEVELPRYNKKKIAIALAIIAGVVLTATFNIIPIMVSAIVGSIALVLTRCITMEDAYTAIDWKVIFLLAGALSLGLSLEKTGAAQLLSDYLIKLFGHLGPIAVLSMLYLLTTLLTEIMSNNACAVLLAPIAIATATAMEVDPRPFLMAITFAASTSLMTPVGYQTNTMIYAAGEYRFTDFLKVGAPLNIIFWILATLFIPIFWPF